MALPPQKKSPSHLHGTKKSRRTKRAAAESCTLQASLALAFRRENN
jgi:hypothetical protein